MKRTSTTTVAVKRILVPIDFSSASQRAATLAFALARQLGAQVRCMTVVNVLELPAALRASLRDIQTAADLERGIRTWLKGAFAKLTGGAGIEVDRRVRRGITEEEILKEVRRYKPDFIVMGSNGIARRFPIGSRTRAVMRTTTVPVLVVRPVDRASGDVRA